MLGRRKLDAWLPIISVLLGAFLSWMVYTSRISFSVEVLQFKVQRLEKEIDNLHTTMSKLLTDGLSQQ